MYKFVTAISHARFKYLTFFLFLLVSVSVLAVLALKAEAEVAIFHSDNYVEQAVEVADETGITKHIQYDYVWSDFKGTVPEGVVADSITLRIVWSSVIRSLVTLPEGEALAATTSEMVPEIAPLDEVTSQEESVGESLTEESASLNEPEIIEVLEPEQIVEPSEVVEPSLDIEQTDTTLPDSVLEETTTEEPVSEPLPQEGDDTLDTEGFPPVSLNERYVYANAQFEESVATDTVITIVEESPEVMLAESISTTSGYIAPDIIVESLNEQFFEVRYTTDGVIWHSLGFIGLDESHESVFDLSHIPTEAIPSLQIAIRYTIPEGNQTKLIFDLVQLEVGHTVPIVEEVIEPTVPNDNEPNFAVSAIKADVQSENIRAVVLERGGVFEFWYSVTDLQSGAVFWNKILGGGAIDENAPIGIKKRTIFWLDRNQQTLFGFAVDEESIFATPFQDSENKVFLLPFMDENGKQWEALFNASENVLEFNKVKSES